jgi:hypothetical protein
MATDTSVLASQVFASDRRRSERRDVALRTLGTDRFGKVFEARLINLSRSGFMAETSHQLTEHHRIAIDVPTIGPLTAWVVWSMPNRVGGSFVTPIDAETYGLLGRLFDIE